MVTEFEGEGVNFEDAVRGCFEVADDMKTF